MSADGVDRGSDLLLNRAGRDGLGDGPVDGFDKPGVAAEPDFLGSGVDLGCEVIGEAEVNVFGHGKDGSTLVSTVRSDSIYAMTTPAHNFRPSYLLTLSNVLDRRTIYVSHIECVCGWWRRTSDVTATQNLMEQHWRTRN